MNVGTLLAKGDGMNGRASDTNAGASCGLEDSANRGAPVSAVQPSVLPVWEGWAGFDGNNCVCIEARLYLPRISGNAGILPYSFETHSFPVVVQFGGSLREE